MNGNWRGFTSGNPLFHSCINYNSWYGVTFINAKSWMYFFWKNHWFLPLVKTKMWKSHIYRSTAECSCLKIRSYFLFLIMPKHHFSKEIKGRFFFKPPKKTSKKPAFYYFVWGISWFWVKSKAHHWTEEWYYRAREKLNFLGHFPHTRGKHAF